MSDNIPVKSDFVYRYLYKNNTKVQIIHVNLISDRIIRQSNITIYSQKRTIKVVTSLAVALSLELKDVNSYISTSLKCKSFSKNFSVTAFGDGRVCGFVDPFTPNEADENYILEVTRHSDGFDYTSIVSAKRISTLISSYINNSLQRSALFRNDWSRSEIFSVFIEDLPGTKNAAKARLELAPYFQNLKISYIDKDIFREIEVREFFYGCNCSKKIAQRILDSLSDNDKAAIGNSAEVVCKFCGEKYGVKL